MFVVKINCLNPRVCVLMIKSADEMMEIYFFVSSIHLFFFKVCKLKLGAKPSYRLKGNFLNSQSSFY